MVDRRPKLPHPSDVSPESDPTGLITSGATSSPWTATVPPILTRPLDAPEKAQVCIVGAGISGMTTAYRLVEAGMDVVVLEDGAVGSGETGRTTAHFTNSMDDRYSTIEDKHGTNAAKLAAESHTRAIATVASVVKEERIACHAERVDGYLSLHPSDQASTLDDEYAACRRIGMDVELVHEAPHFDAGRALRFPRQFQLHPLEYLRGLTKAVTNGGGRIYTASHADIQGKGTKVGANGFPVDAQRVVVCTNAPVSTKLSIHAKQMPFRTYVIAAEVRKGTIPHCMWWDTGDHDAPSPFPPYHYVRLQAMPGGKELLISGGQDHRLGFFEHVKVDPFQRLEDWTRERFPEMGRVAYRWSGQVMEPADHLAYIGAEPLSRSRYLAAGDSGNGMTHGTIAGILISDLILGQANPWETLYDPRRKNLRSVGAVLREHLGAGKKMLKHLGPREVTSAAALGTGEGAVLGSPAPKAVYRDEKGELHACSAVCPHLKCIVAWNPVERSFDCPCHGSRFTAFGAVVSGPANEDLARVQLDKDEVGTIRRTKRHAEPKVRDKRTQRHVRPTAGGKRTQRHVRPKTRAKRTHAVQAGGSGNASPSRRAR